MMNITEYKMKPGVYIEDKNIGELAKEHLEGNPIILNYEYKIIDNGTNKDTLGFGVKFMDAQKGLEKFNPEVFDDALQRVNNFLEESTGRRAELRKKDMKPDY